MSLIKDGPAAKSGEVSVGDLLHSIDGHSIDTLDDGAHTQETAIIHLSTMHKPTHKLNSNRKSVLCMLQTKQSHSFDPTCTQEYTLSCTT